MPGVTTPYDPYWSDHSTWVGVQDNDTQYLVQGGYGISGFNSTYSYGFFWEFSGPGSTGVVDITSQVVFPVNWAPSDRIRFNIWYHDTNSWGFGIIDDSAGGYVMFSRYIHPSVSGVADAYIGHTAIVATEANGVDDNFNNGVITIRQPYYHVRNSAWILFENMYTAGLGYQGLGNMNRNGNTDESGSTVDPAGYAYHTWHNFNQKTRT